MSDLGLTWTTPFGADFTLAANDLAVDEGLETAVLLSLFLDRRADGDDVIPDGTDDRRGYWGDAFPEVPNDLIGSRLWLLSREKQVQTVLSRAEEYAREALQWLLDDRVSDRIEVTAEFVRAGVLGIRVVIHRPRKAPAQFRYDFNWQAQLAKGA
jgi:phage gp46-like protein